jgi:hypothetical protein
MIGSPYHAFPAQALRAAIQVEHSAFQKKADQDGRLAWDHVRIHGMMLFYGAKQCDWTEGFGQITRILVAAPGSWFKSAPTGNSGRARVGLLQTQPVPPDLQGILAPFAQG